jgi:hypothetical protein
LEDSLEVISGEMSKELKGISPGNK